jgi:hypothetical protein
MMLAAVGVDDNGDGKCFPIPPESRDGLVDRLCEQAGQKYVD